MKSVEESVNQLTDQMVQFCTKTRRQRINQRNRTERLSDLLDWKRMGLEYAKARQLALRRAYPDGFEDEDADFESALQRVGRPLSAPASPRFRGGLRDGTATPGDLGTLTEVRSSWWLDDLCALTPRLQGMERLDTSDYNGARWNGDAADDEDAYPFPLVLKRRGTSVGSGLTSGQSTPGGHPIMNGNGKVVAAGRAKTLSEGDLQKADEALSQRK